MSKQDNKEFNALLNEGRDIEELNRIMRAYKLGQDSANGGVGVLKAKLDKIHNEILDGRYGFNKEGETKKYE